MGGAFVGGVFGGLIGAAIWAGVGYWTGYEVGWIAWGIGILVGVGVFSGSGGRAGAGGAVLGGIIAIASVVGGKWAVLQLSTGVHSDELPIAAIADSILEEYYQAGEHVELPPEEDASSWEDLYPAHIWTAARERWNRLDDADQVAFKAALANEQPSLLASFSPFDLLWLALAVGTAAKIGAGSRDDTMAKPVKLLDDPNRPAGMAILPPASGSGDSGPRAAA
ncbi:MAG: hypothetical protein ACYS0D_07680 [Planctomycetota bacterium]|jgi:hypothetical protein